MGTLITALGIVVAARHWALAILFAVVFLAVYLPAIELEEQHLRVLFPAYTDYAARVNRFLPFSKWPNGGGAFSWALYKKNEEYKAAIGFSIAVVWLVWLCWPSVIRFRS